MARKRYVLTYGPHRFNHLYYILSLEKYEVIQVCTLRFVCACAFFLVIKVYPKQQMHYQKVFI